MNYNENRGLFKLILLAPLTFGLYAIYFWYKYAQDVNLMCDGDGKHTTNYLVVLLLTPLTLGIYPLVWVKNMQDRLRNCGNEKGCNIAQKGGTIVAWYTFGWILFGIGPLIGLYQQISTINQVAIALNRSPNKKVNAAPVNSAPLSNAFVPDISSFASSTALHSPVSIAPDAPVVQKPIDSIMCPKCHEVQRLSRIVCQRCGAVLPRIDVATISPGRQELPQWTPEKSATAPAMQGALAERASFGNATVSGYPNQPVAPMQTRYMTPAAQNADMNSRHRRTLSPDGAPVSLDRQDERIAPAADAIRVPARDAYTVSRSIADQRQIIHPQVSSLQNTEPSEVSSFQKSIQVYQQKLSELVQNLPEPKPVYLWASLAASGLMSIIALMVSIFR